MDMTDLEEQLKQAKNCRRRIIVTDGVFSMDGDEAPLKEILALADQYNAIVLVDDCHATGFIGPTGRGTDEACVRDWFRIVRKDRHHQFDVRESHVWRNGWIYHWA